MADQPLMLIGMFSRASLLSVRSLRSYHEQGILVPALIDPATGYRAYHPGQLADASVLRRLRELDLPLPAVREILQARDPEITRKLLGDHEVVMRSRLDRTEKIVTELQKAVAEPADETPVHVRRIEHMHALAIEDTVASEDFSSFLGVAFATLLDVASRSGMVLAGPSGALYEPEIHDSDSEHVVAYLPVEVPARVPSVLRRASVIELPERTVAAVVHKGSYETIGDTYSTLGAWVAHNAATADDPVRETYLVSVPDTDDPAEYRTEICWPIHQDK